MMSSGSAVARSLSQAISDSSDYFVLAEPSIVEDELLYPHDVFRISDQCKALGGATGGYIKKSSGCL